jgi:hypothetical protein
MSRFRASLDVIHTPIDARSPGGVECRRCGSALDLHQPDERLADRLLGTCPDCLAWYLIDDATGLMALLPDEAALRDA